MQAGTQIHQALGPEDERGQDIGRQGIDGEYVWQAILGQAARLLISDRGIVDDGIKGAKGVDIVGKLARLRDAGEIAEQNSLSAGDSSHGIARSLIIARVKHGAVSLLDEKLSGHATEAVGGTGDEDARHGL